MGKDGEEALVMTTEECKKDDKQQYSGEETEP